MDSCLKAVIGHCASPLSGRVFAPMAMDLCVAMVSGSAPYLFKPPVGEEFIE